MALADFTAFRTAVSGGFPSIIPYVSSITTGGVDISILSSWDRMGGTFPTTAAACGAATPGAAIGVERSQGRMISSFACYLSSGTNSVTSFLIIDRLSHQGGLSGNVTTTQTTNLPTAALTRYTSGVGVFAALEIHTSLGTTDTSATTSYTNQAGTSGRTGSIVLGTMTPSAHSFYPMNLQAGDIGVRSVESVTFSVATGTVGACGIVLYKPIAMIPPERSNLSEVPATQIVGWNTGIDTDACLQLLMSTYSLAFYSIVINTYPV